MSTYRKWIVYGKEGEGLTVGPFPGAPDFALCITTEDEKAKKWFGNVSISLSPEHARELGISLIEAAEWMSKARK